MSKSACTLAAVLVVSLMMGAGTTSLKAGSPTVATFSGIGFLPGDGGSQVRAADETGSVAGGSSYHTGTTGSFEYRSARWRLARGIKPLPLLPDNPSAGTSLSFVTGTDVTPDGARILFRSHTDPANLVGEASGICDADGSNVIALSSLPGGQVMRSANQISDDGLIAFGWGLGSNPTKTGGFIHSSRWTSSGFQVLAEPSGYTDSRPSARGASADGTISVGDLFAYDVNLNLSGHQAYRWTATEGMQGVGYLRGGTRSASLAVSSNGSTMFGYSTSAKFPGTYAAEGELFLWTSMEGMVGLGRPTGYKDFFFQPFGGLNADGTVGAVPLYNPNLTTGGSQSFIVDTATRSYFNVKDVLVEAGAATVVAGWGDFFVFGITDNGNTVFGDAINPLGKNEGFIARFPNGYLQSLVPPSIRSPRSATGAVGELFTYLIVATNRPTSYSVSNLPAGLSFDPVLGVITGTPSEAATTQITIGATNRKGTRTAILTIAVDAAAATGPVITSGTSASAKTGQAFPFQITLSGVSSAATIAARGLPPGLSIDLTTGAIFGIPTSAGSFAVRLTVTDRSASVTGILQLTVSSDPAFPAITSSATGFVTPGKQFSYKIKAPGSNDPNDPTTYAISGNLPEGLTFDPATGIISGTPVATSYSGSATISELNAPAGTVIGTVQLFAHNSHGTATKTLTFLTAKEAAAVNISTRLAVGTGENVLIGGFIITGTAPKKVIIRAIGPSLTTGGAPVAGRLEDTALELHGSDNSLIVRNDNWRSAQQQAILDSNIAPSDDRESAIVATLQPGNYTAIVSGKGQTSGIGLVEVYDLDTAATSELANISSRGLVKTGDDVMIGGFILSAGSARNVIIRAIGPSLPVNGKLADPVLELRGPNGELLGSNDSWRTGGQEQEIIDTGIPPSNDAESALVRNLAPGVYTAIVRGVNDTTGVALVEVFALQ